MASQATALKTAVIGTPVIARRCAGQPFKPVPAVPRGRNPVIVNAQKDQRDGKADTQVAMRVLGAVAAAQLAVLPMAGPAAAANFIEEIKEQIASPAAREQANQQLDAAPTVTDVGKSLGKEFGQNSPTEVGDNVKGAAQAVKSQVGKSAPDSGDLKGAAAELKDKVSLDLGEVLSNITGGSNPGNVYDVARESAKQATYPGDTVKDNATSGVGNTDPTPDPEEAKDDVDRLTGKVGDSPNPGPGRSGNIFKQSGFRVGPAGSLRDLVAINDLPSATELKNKAANAAPDLPGSNNLFQDLSNKLTGNNPADQAKRAASDVKSQIGKASSDLPDGSDIANKVNANTPDLKGAAKDLKNKVSFGSFENAANKAGDAVGAAKNAAGDVKDKADSGLPSFNLPTLPNFSAPSSVPSPSDAADAAKSAAGDVKSQVGKAGNNLPDASDIGSKIKDAAPSTSNVANKPI